MNYFEKKLSIDGSYAKYYFQEANEEIDSTRKYPTIVICPGGAYLWTSFREDESVALRFLAEGFHVVVVHYATEGREVMSVSDSEKLPVNPVSMFPNPLVCLAEAVAFLRENSEQFAVDPDYIIVGGFSAGGNVAGLLGTRWHEEWLEKLVGKDRSLYRPTHLLLAYAAYDLKPKTANSTSIDNVIYAATGDVNPSEATIKELNLISNVSTLTPPTFIWHTREDVLTPSIGALEFSLALEKVGIPYELHLFDKGKHGLVLGDLRTGTKASNMNAQVYKWIDLFLEWIVPYKTQNGGFYHPIEN
ncbi:alpha/beta hydrolase [Streptococcus suis]|uniref:alpha/beta hydrolase n=1 Tax=Streptococcus suis TaxID=1307 RepID=UPI0037584A75